MTLTNPSAEDTGDIPDPDLYRTLLESTRAIPWRIDWSTLTFAYIGPQIQALLGWPRDSWVSIDDWAERMHPEDRQKTVEFCVAQSKEGVDHEADYRALTSTGNYVWIRDVVHVLRDRNGDVEALVGFMFDISERKQLEEQLLQSHSKLQDLSYRDGLTGIHNRRMFDMRLEADWDTALRTGQPLSLLIIDIDRFKEYNDCYGHVQGDKCLQRVSDLLSSAASRRGDLCARIGGEEFALILTEADEAAALRVAERCHELIRQQNIPHVCSTVASRLTISIGVATVVPGRDDRIDRFIEAADRALYEAKQQGRNETAAGSVADSFPASRPGSASDSL